MQLILPTDFILQIRNEFILFYLQIQRIVVYDIKLVIMKMPPETSGFSFAIIIAVLRQGLMYPWLASNLLCSSG